MRTEEIVRQAFSWCFTFWMIASFAIVLNDGNGNYSFLHERSQVATTCCLACASLNSFGYIVRPTEIHWTEFIASRIMCSTQLGWNIIHSQSMSSPWISFWFIQISRHAFERALHSAVVLAAAHAIRLLFRLLNGTKDLSVAQRQPSLAWELRACDSDVQTKQQFFAHLVNSK